MTDAARKAKNKYQREYLKAHPEKRREYQANYWERKGQELMKKNEEISSF